MEILIVITLVAIIASLGHALFSMSSGKGDSRAMVRALTIRITLSVALFAILMIGWYTGHLQPHGIR
jgi:Na+-driven multidrug efflux pump